MQETAHGYLAQLVERLTVNQIVIGSIPIISATLTEVYLSKSITVDGQLKESV